MSNGHWKVAIMMSKQACFLLPSDVTFCSFSALSCPLEDSPNHWLLSNTAGHLSWCCSVMGGSMNVEERVLPAGQFKMGALTHSMFVLTGEGSHV